MNKWLERALLSAGAAVVSTTAIVTTAEKDGKKKKRKKGKKAKKGDKESSRGADGALIDDDVPRSIGAQAAHDYRTGHDGGLTGSEFLDNVRSAGSKAANGVSRFGKLLFSRAPSAPPGEGDSDAAPKAKRRRKVRRRVRRKKGEGPPEPRPEGARKKKRKKQRAPEPNDEFSELRDEAAKAAARAAAKGVADKAGVSETVETIKEQSKQLWEKTEKLSAQVREKVPEDLGKRVGESFEEAGRSIRDGANKLSDRVRDAVGEDEETGEDIGDKVERGIRGVMRWVEGPGAPEYDAAPKPRRVRPADDSEDEVDAKEPPAEPTSSEEPDKSSGGDDAPQA